VQYVVQGIVQVVTCYLSCVHACQCASRALLHGLLHCSFRANINLPFSALCGKLSVMLNSRPQPQAAPFHRCLTWHSSSSFALSKLLPVQVLLLPDHVLDVLTRRESPGLCPDTTRSFTSLVLCFYGELASSSSLVMFAPCLAQTEICAYACCCCCCCCFGLTYTMSSATAVSYFSPVL